MKMKEKQAISPFAFLLAAFLFGTASTPPLVAFQKPTVAVRFALTESTYASEFTPEKIREMESLLAQGLAARMRRQIAFLEFEAGAEADTTLIFDLNRADPEADPGSSQDVVFHIRLDGSERCPKARTAWKFRPETEFGARVGEFEEFHQEIVLKLDLNAEDEAQMQKDYKLLVPGLLGCVPIAETGLFFNGRLGGQDQMGWLIPYQRSELCLDAQSVLLIDGELVAGVGTSRDVFSAAPKWDFNPAEVVPADLDQYRNQIFSVPLGDPAALAAASSISVHKIYVVKYLFSRSACQRVIPATEVDFDEGGEL